MSDFFFSQICTQAFLASLLSGFITSFVFLFCLLFFLKPRVGVSPVVATSIDKLDSNDPKRQYWVFKVVNKSLFSAFDMKVEVVQKIPHYGPNGAQNYRTRQVRLLRSEYHHVAPYRWSKSYSDYALWFVTYDDITKILQENNHVMIELRLICRHALTGLGNARRQQYTITDIKAGIFKSGNTFEVEQLN